MRRSLRFAGMALGLPFIVALVSSCADQLTRPVTMRSVSLAASIVYPDVRISEIHYDNAGTDAGEAIEISGPAGASLTGWSIVLYNGSGGAAYNTRALTGTIPATCGDRGVVFVTYPLNGIQNGNPDGIALVGPGGVAEFISYGGTMTAVGGVANGMVSHDIAVTEGTSTPIGHSLQRSESDAWYWQAPSASTFGSCNSFSAPAIASVTVTPTPTSVVEGATRTLTARAFAADGKFLGGAPMEWASDDASVATVDGGGVVTGVAVGETRIHATAANGATGSALVSVEAADPTPPSGPVRIVEIHYDNDGADVGEAIEIIGPAGYRVSGWTLVLYNGNGGGTYGTIALSGVFPSQADGQGVLWFPAPGLQNGDPDGVALVDGFGTVVEFLSYDGVMTATNGPASGMQSTDIGVGESSTSAIGRSLQKDADGWYGPATASFGAINVAPPPSVSIFGRPASDGPLPVGFEDQIFAEVRDKFNAVLPTTFTWTSETPDVASVDQDGVVRALAPGTAIIRATGANGFTGSATLPTYVATASTTAQYGGNTEFGIPADSDPSDDFIVTRDQYTASFNGNRGIPNWVSFNLEATHTGTQSRCECFTYDPALPAAFPRYTTADYTGAGAFHGYGIDRGHLVRSFDRTAGSLDNATTFYFSNIIPQASDNNQGPWGDLELYLGNLAQSGDRELYVIAGASGSKGTIKNEGLITIPTHTWKVAVIMPRNHGLANVDSHDDVQVIAVIMPNDAGIDGVDWNTYRTSVNAIETLSGYDLLALLPDGVEALVETGLSPAQGVVDALLASGTIDAGVANSLSAKLAAASASMERGSVTAAHNQLRALLNEIQALERSRRLSAADAAALRAAVNAVLGSN
jgi:DNA/RNA endonuclease G (NUC1)